MNAPPSCRWLGLGLVTLALLAFNQTGAAQFVELSAEIQISTPATGFGFRTNSSVVQCVVGTNRWRMDIELGRETRATCWFTGTNFNELQTWLPGNSFGRVGVRLSERYESNDGNPGRPQRVRDLLIDGNRRIAWLAFCSSATFKNDGRRLYPFGAFWKYHVSEPPEGFPHRFELFPDTLGLPRSVGLRTANQETIFHYRANATTNVSGWTFPSEFALTEYLPNELGRWKTVFFIVGKLKSARVVPEMVFPTETSGPAGDARR